jgi:hypothetical protein
MSRGERGPRGDHGQKGEQGERGEQGFGFTKVRSQGIVYLVCFLAIGYAWYTNHEGIERIEAERAERTNQSCNISERKQAEDIRKLRLTYGYLASLNPRQRRQPLNALIFQQLSRYESEARLDDAPAFCDVKGVGRPEPDPKFPKRPKSL